MISPYITPKEAAKRMGVSWTTVKRRIGDGSIPTLILSPQIMRVEEKAMKPEAPEPIPPVAEMGTAELAFWFGVHPATVRRLVRDGELRGLMVGGRLVFRKKSILAFITDHTNEGDTEE